MFFLNLGLGPLLAIATAASALIVALYLFDRSRRRQTVSTLRFWTAARHPVEAATRRHIQQPVSLLLQILGLLLLLLAIAQPRLGNPFARPQSHVLILDASAWMSAPRLVDQARDRANAWLRTLPPTDPVMLLRADALATPSTPFELDRAALQKAIADTRPSSTGLDLAQALDAARRAQSLQNATGEIVFIGSGRIDPQAPAPDTKNIRAILLNTRIEHAGLRAVSLHRDLADPTKWLIAATVHNYGRAPRDLTLANRQIHVPPGQDTQTAFTTLAAALNLQLTPTNPIDGDDRIDLQLPIQPPTSVAIYTDNPEAARPFLNANPRIQPTFLKPTQTTTQPAIYLNPKPKNSPIAITTSLTNPKGLTWTTDPTLGSGLRAHDLRLTTASVFQPAPHDIQIAAVPQGPILIARPGPTKIAVFGFDPAAPSLRYELSTPIVFANILRWMLPDAFLQTDLTVRTPGTITTTLEGDHGPITVTRADGTPVPFTLEGRTLRFFSSTRDTIRIRTGDRESQMTLALPELFDAIWTPPATIPRRHQQTPITQELWPWLATLGAVCLLAEWLLYSRKRDPQSRILKKAA